MSGSGSAFEGALGSSPLVSSRKSDVLTFRLLFPFGSPRDCQRLPEKIPHAGGVRHSGYPEGCLTFTYGIEPYPLMNEYVSW